MIIATIYWALIMYKVMGLNVLCIVSDMIAIVTISNS